MPQNSYNQIAAQWHANQRGAAYTERVLGYVDQILAGLPPHAKVLDLGCGTGQPIAQHIVERGFRVVGVDQSREMLKIARSLVPTAEFICADMVALEFTEKFAAIVAWDSLFHIERTQRAAIFRKLWHALELGGWLLLSVGGSDSTPAGFTSEMFGATFFYSGYAPDVTRQMLEAAGFTLESWEVDDASSRGHIAAIARKI